MLDDIPPVIIRPCPADIEITASASQMDVSWEEPIFSDPGGKHVLVSSNFSPGSKFGVGNYAVEYSGTNEITGRSTKCGFHINVTRKESINDFFANMKK